MRLTLPRWQSDQVEDDDVVVDTMSTRTRLTVRWDAGATSVGRLLLKCVKLTCDAADGSAPPTTISPHPRCCRLQLTETCLRLSAFCLLSGCYLWVFVFVPLLFMLWFLFLLLSMVCACLPGGQLVSGSHWQNHTNFDRFAINLYLAQA